MHEYLSVYIEICVIYSSRAFIYVLLIKSNLIADSNLVLYMYLHIFVINMPLHNL